MLDSFMVKLDDRLDQRLSAERTAQAARTAASRNPDAGLPLGIASVIAGIPTTAIAAGNAGLGGMAVTWCGIALVNLAFALGRRRG